ncbi:MAG: type II secretion system F family protein [Desulfurococcales archaeon]|nr:type II secretion system F family protein [Desulfurococcales archaeon]
MARWRLRRRRRPPVIRVYRRPPRKVTLVELFDYISIQYFGGLGARVAQAFELEKAIREAGMLTYYQLYAARLITVTVMAALLSLYLIFLLILTELSLLVKAISVILLSLIPVFVFSYGLAYPAIKRGERRQGVETELPFFAAYLTTMVRAGLSAGNVIERVSRLKIFKAIRREALLIVRNMNIFGKDPIEAIEDNALYHPSYRYRDFMMGYTTTVKTGGDVGHYLEIRTQDIFNARMTELKLIAERMSLFTEIYVTIAVIMALVFYIFFTISSVFPAAGGFGGTAQLSLFTFVILPVLTLLILYMIHSAQPKEPIWWASPYRAFVLIGLPLATIVGPIMFYMTGAVDVIRGREINYNSIMGLSIALASLLLSLSIPPAVYYTMEKRRHKGMAEATAAFLRDLTEIRKTGLSPERSIVSLASRNYGPFTKIVARVATALTVGLNLEQALRTAMRGYKDWLLLANMRFLADSIELGGGSPETLDALARYAHNLVELEKEMKRRLRTYIIMPYMGAVLVALASILVLGFTAETLSTLQGGAPGIARVSPEDIARVALLLSLGTIFNSWLMGIVAGKIQDQRVAAGFTHGIILVVLTLVTLAISLQRIPVLVQPPA